jgi:hypothetical protein
LSSWQLISSLLSRRTGTYVQPRSALADGRVSVGAINSRSTQKGGTQAMPYQVEGRLLEVCTCNVVCPCWLGEDPDNGLCEALLVWSVDKGTVNGADVSGLVLGMLAHIPGNILKGNWKAHVYVDDKASEAQMEALLSVWMGKLGGPIADWAKLVGEFLSVEQAPITFDVKDADATLKMGPSIEANVAPVVGAGGLAVRVHDSVFTTIPGAPAYVGKASQLRVSAPGFQIDIEGHSAVSTTFRFNG